LQPPLPASVRTSPLPTLSTRTRQPASHSLDSVEQARQLVKLLKAVPCKINLIPFNPFPQSGYQRSDAAAVARFRDVLMQAEYTVMVRKTRGDDIDAACGQLAGQVQDKTRRHERRPTVATA